MHCVWTAAKFHVSANQETQRLEMNHPPMPTTLPSAQASAAALHASMIWKHCKSHSTLALLALAAKKVEAAKAPVPQKCKRLRVRHRACKDRMRRIFHLRECRQDEVGRWQIERLFSTALKGDTHAMQPTQHPGGLLTAPWEVVWFSWPSMSHAGRVTSS